MARHNTDFGERLKAYRMDREWTQAQLANAVGLTRGAISKIENNECEPTDLTKHKIMKKIPSLREAKSA